jgi:hypothetical protein
MVNKNNNNNKVALTTSSNLNFQNNLGAHTISGMPSKIDG